MTNIGEHAGMTNMGERAGMTHTGEHAGMTNMGEHARMTTGRHVGVFAAGIQKHGARKTDATLLDPG